MNKQVVFSATALVALLALAGCSEAPKPAVKAETEAAKEAAKPPEAVPARQAFFELYKPARVWAADLLALSVVSGEIPDIKNEAGKAGLWTVVFVSPSRKEARTFTYAAADSGETIHKGVNIGNAVVWGGSTKDSKPFSSSEFAVDSDAAYKVAAAKAGGWLQAHPGMKPTLRLGNASRFSAPVWYVQWGTTKNGYAALVNASTGGLAK